MRVMNSKLGGAPEYCGVALPWDLPEQIEWTSGRDRRRNLQSTSQHCLIKETTKRKKEEEEV
jgi:hypothetical protein